MYRITMKLDGGAPFSATSISLPVPGESWEIYLRGGLNRKLTFDVCMMTQPLKGGTSFFKANDRVIAFEYEKVL